MRAATHHFESSERRRDEILQDRMGPKHLLEARKVFRMIEWTCASFEAPIDEGMVHEVSEDVTLGRHSDEIDHTS